MKERPILFSGPMVRAIIDGRKTQTRRVVKPQPPSLTKYCDIHIPSRKWQAFGGDGFRYGGWKEPPCPFGVPGDRLWVRETWQAYLSYGERGELLDFWEPRCEGDRPDHIEYLATVEDGHHPSRWRPSIHMPRWASRLLLEVVSVRVERLADISEADAKAEGYASADEFLGAPWAVSVGPNPWVWVVEFRRITP